MNGLLAGALTVAGQWRSFTAFPSILAIAVMGCAAPLGEQHRWHGRDFHAINIYKPDGRQSQKKEW
jgi:hypothetical protein